MRPLAFIALVAALLGCDNNAPLISVHRPSVVAGEVTRQSDGEMRTQAVSITPITSTSASRSGLAFSGDRVDVTCALSGSVTLYAAAHDGTAWHVWQAAPCALDSTTAARGSCSFAARRDSALVWNVFKTGGGTASSCTATGAYGPVARSGSGGGLTNVSVSSPLTGDGTSGSHLALNYDSTLTLVGGSLSVAAHAASHRAGGTDALLSAPGAIGGGTPAAGSFTTLGGTVITASTRVDTPSVGTSSGAQHALPSGTAALVATDSALLYDYRHLFTTAVSGTNYFGQATTGAVQPRDARAVRVLVSGTVNYVSLTALNTTGAGSVTVQIYASTDGNTYSAVSGASRTITTSVSGSLTDNGAQSDFNVTAGDWLLARISGYSGTTASLSVVIRAGSGARLAMRMPANDNARPSRRMAA